MAQSPPKRVIRQVRETARGIGPARREGPVARLDLTYSCPDSLRALLMQHLGVASHQIHVGHGPLGLADLEELTDFGVGTRT